MVKRRFVRNNIVRPKRKPKKDHRVYLFNQWMKMVRKNKKLKATLYFVELSDEDETFLKIGVTTTSVYKRFKDSVYRFKKIKSVTGDCKTVFQLESKVLTRFKKKRYYPSKKFSGFTECFQMSAKSEILSYIKSIK